MKFSEIKYERPDVEAMKSFLSSAAQRLSAAESFAEAEAVFLEVEKRSAELDTMLTVANIRHDMDTEDEFYDAEVAFADEALPELEEFSQSFDLALLNSPFRADFAEKYCEIMFTNTELSLRCFSPEIIPELQRENALTTEYAKLLASAQIEFEGGRYTLSQLTPIKQDADDARRRAAWLAEGEWLEAQGQRLDEIFDELVALRDSMGKKLGFGGYTGLGYCRMTRNCYGMEEVESFRSAVREYIVPIAAEIFRRQAARLGKSYPMDYADNALEFRSGNARPCGSAEDILDAGRRFYHELSGETAEFIDFMYEGGYLDVLSRKGKAGGGYCTCLPTVRAPFIFANFNGTSGDVEVITHEAGHAFQNYVARDLVPLSCQWPTMEACEVHSMSMEFFAWPWAERFFGGDAAKFRYAHLSGALTFIPYGTLVDHFQHECYERPQMSPAERNALWKELCGVYLPWMDTETLPFYKEGRFWQRQRHIYESPFYYIDYCLAQTVALQFWAEIQDDREAAWQRYMAYTRPAGTQSFTQLLEGAGLSSPFEPETLHRVAQAAQEWLSRPENEIRE